MKNLVCILLLLLPCEVFSQLSQDNLGTKAKVLSVEKSLFGLQLGLLSPWFTYEHGLSERVSLQSEVGLFNSFGATSNSWEFGTVPVVSVEPRWYYFLAEEDHFTKNSGDFLTLRTMIVLPFAYTITNEMSGFISLPTTISFIPKWAHRRTLWDHFTYEVGIGAGLTVSPGGGLTRISTLWAINQHLGIIIDVHLRVGYTF